jgi:DNA-directed RNA polymerase subunit beta'
MASDNPEVLSDPETFFFVINEMTGNCLDVRFISLDEGACIFQCPCNGGDNQQWQFLQNSEGYFELIAKHSGKALDDANKSRQDGGLVHQWSRHHGHNQQWKLEPAGDGCYFICSRTGGLCLDAAHDGETIHLWSFHGKDNQKWRLRDARKPSYQEREFRCPNPQCRRGMSLTLAEFAARTYACPWCNASGSVPEMRTAAPESSESRIGRDEDSDSTALPVFRDTDGREYSYVRGHRVYSGDAPLQSESALSQPDRLSETNAMDGPTPSYRDRNFRCPNPKCRKVMVLTPEEFSAGTYACPYCGLSGRASATHHEPTYSERKFTCPDCSKVIILTPEEYANKTYHCPHCFSSNARAQSQRPAKHGEPSGDNDVDPLTAEPPPSAEDAADVAKLLTKIELQARQCATKGELAEAIDLALQCVNLQASPNLLHFLASLYLRQGDWKNALSWCQRAVAVNHEDARLLFARINFEIAATFPSDEIRQNLYAYGCQGDPRVMDYLATLFAEKGDTEQSLLWHEKALVGGYEDARQTIIKMLLRQAEEAANRDGTDRLLLRASEHGSAEADFRLGMLFKKDGDTARAREHLCKAASADHIWAQYEFGLMLAEGGQVAEAMDWLAKAKGAGHHRAAEAHARLSGVGDDEDEGVSPEGTNPKGDILHDSLGGETRRQSEDCRTFFISIGIASADTIRTWSRGEVKNPETINESTFKPETGGLFCERIFGPTRDWECSCGKYKRIKHKGVICDRCGVEVTLSRVRRERMAHIELAIPVCHSWFFKRASSPVGLLLDMTSEQLDRVVSHQDSVVLDPGETPLARCQTLTQAELAYAREQFGDTIDARTGAEVFKELLARLDLSGLAGELELAIAETRSKETRERLIKRLKLVRGMQKSSTRPEWMVLDVIPVMPPDLRPLIPIEGGRFAEGTLNDRYLRVIRRNNNLRNLVRIETPEAILRNEKRLLQEAVDALMNHERLAKPVFASNASPSLHPLTDGRQREHGRFHEDTNDWEFFGLSDNSEGKDGHFEKILNGKTVDHSARTVIVSGPELKLHQCGLPMRMALVLFEPFIIRVLKERGYVHTVRSAKKMIAAQPPEVWDILEEVTKDHPVLISHPGTFERLSIQAFEPVLIEGDAIQINPLVCPAYHACFDGDEVTVHVPLSFEAQMEARLLMLAPNNLFSPLSGKPIFVPSQDIVIGCYCLTQEPRNPKREGERLPLFGNSSEVEFAMAEHKVKVLDRIRFKNPDVGKRTVFGDPELKVLETTVGRVVFSGILPNGVGFINRTCWKNQLCQMIGATHQVAGHQATITMLDQLKDLGFHWATRAGISVGIKDVIIPEQKQRSLDHALKSVAEIDKQYRRGIITDGERHNKVIDTWAQANNAISDIMFRTLMHNEGRKEINPVYLMVDSGVLGSRRQANRIGGMVGLVGKPDGSIVETQIAANFREGLTGFQYFISTHDTWKSFSDTALGRAELENLARPLVYCAQDVVIVTGDCRTSQGIVVRAIYDGDDEVVSLATRIIGRVSAESIKDPVTGKNIVKKDMMIEEATAAAIDAIGHESMKIRSVLTCEAGRGVCMKCYGRQHATGQMVKLGEAVGVIAAQSIVEAGAEGLRRSLQTGASVRPLKMPIIKAKNDGVIHFNELRVVQSTDEKWIALNKNGFITICTKNGRELERHVIVLGSVIAVADGGTVKKGEAFVEWDPYNVPILTEKAGKVVFKDMIQGVTVKKEMDESTGVMGMVVIENEEDLHPSIVIQDEGRKIVATYPVPAGAHLAVQEGKRVPGGTLLAKTPRSLAKFSAGFPRVVELLEAERPKDACEISRIDGVIEIGGIDGGNRLVLVRDDGAIEAEHFIPLGRQIIVHTGDRVKKGQQITEGPVSLDDILDVLGSVILQEHMVNEVREVFRLQSVQLADIHVEIIIRQLLRKVKITDPGDTPFLWGDQVDRLTFTEENERIIRKVGKPAKAVPVLLGISKACLGTESFLAAAAFGDARGVLTEASLFGKTDELQGLTESVIAAQLIPCGTRFRPPKTTRTD